MTIATTSVSLETLNAGLLEVRNLRIERRIGSRINTIVSGIDLAVAAGESIAIVGESGSGKSMTVRAIMGLLPPTLQARGEVMYRGRSLLAARERQWREIRGGEIGLVMQDPFTMLNPVLRCGTIIAESLPLARRRELGRNGRKAEAVRRLAEVGILDESVIDRYPFQLSGGMRQRVAVAAALARDPNVLIADEPSTALDVTTQREILALLRSIQQARGMALILITHDLRVAFSMSDRIYVLYAGSLVEVGRAAELDAEPLHPYSHGLLLSEPTHEYRVAELITIPGSVPAPDEVADRCPFAPRCRWVQQVCRDEAPPLREIAQNRFSACVRIADIRGEMAKVRERAQEEANLRIGPRTAPLVIEARHVHKLFHTRRGNVAALKNVSIEVREHESVGLVGESGSGKTTLSRILVGLDSATGGEVLIDGINATDWTKLGIGDRRRLRRVIQIVFQDPYSSLNPMRTVGATLQEAITTHQPAARNVAAQAAELLQMVGLPPEYAPRKPVALSGGERQRVAIARALAVRPRILICDEPVSALDVSVQAQILNLFSSLRSQHGLGYLFISHDLSIVRQVTEHVYVMHRGRIVESGATHEVLTNPQDGYTAKLLESVPRPGMEWINPVGVSGHD